MMGSQCRRYTLVSSTSVASFCENVKLSRKKVVLVVFEKQVLFSFFNYLHTQVDEFTFENLYSWACDIVITYERYAASMDRFLHELQHTKMRGEKMWDDGTRRTIRSDIDVYAQRLPFLEYRRNRLHVHRLLSQFRRDRKCNRLMSQEKNVETSGRWTRIGWIVRRRHTIRLDMLISY